MRTTKPGPISRPATRLLVRILLPGIMLSALAGCRDEDGFDVGPLRPPADAGTTRLTYNIGDDRGPAFSAAGDSIYYAAEGFAGLPDVPGVLLALPRTGGGAAPVAPEQVSAPRAPWLTAPDVAVDGRTAFVEVVRLSNPSVCAGSRFCDVASAKESAPPVAVIGLRVRQAGGGAGGLDPIPDLVVNVAGREILDDAFPQEIETRWFPFQRLFDEERALVFRPSWSPDGSRLVFSDGLRLLLWSPGEAAATPVPNTDDGVMPAWSPDGSRIAFTRLARQDSVRQACRWMAIDVNCHEQRIVYELGEAEVLTVRPDGTGATVVGPGSEPAWAPDGLHIYLVRDRFIWRVPTGDGAAQRMPDTQDGREPALSPDGRLLAFARLASPGNHDIWIKVLAP